jgi:hypothetical protein
MDPRHQETRIDVMVSAAKLYALIVLAICTGEKLDYSSGFCASNLSMQYHRNFIAVPVRRLKFFTAAAMDRDRTAF